LVWSLKKLGSFCKKELICRGVSTSVEGSLIENVKINPKGSGCKQVQSAELRNPGLVGMSVLVVASFSISRILYLLDVYYIRWEVGCQVNFFATKAPRHEENHRFDDWTRIHADFHGK